LFDLFPRTFPPPVFNRLQYANTGGGNGLGMRPLILDRIFTTRKKKQTFFSEKLKGDLVMA